MLCTCKHKLVLHAPRPGAWHVVTGGLRKSLLNSKVGGQSLKRDVMCHFC